MALRYYYFRSEPLDIAAAVARVAGGTGLAEVAPVVTQQSLTVVQMDDAAPNEEDLVAAMADQGLVFVTSSAVAPAFGAVRHYGSQSVVPTVPAPTTGAEYYDTSINWALQYDGASFKGLQWVEIPFVFGTVSPLVITPFNATDYLMRAEVVVDTAFDDAASQLRLGVPGDLGGVLDSTLGQIEPTLADTYRRFDRFTVGADSTLQLTITPGASIQGAGRVFLELWRSR